jgi:hypothetical protein
MDAITLTAKDMSAKTSFAASSLLKLQQILKTVAWNMSLTK